MSTGAFTVTVDIDQSRLPWNTLRTTGWDGFLDDQNGQAIATVFGEPNSSPNIVMLLNPGNEVTTAVQAWVGPPRGREELGTTYHFRTDGKLFMVTRLADAESGFSGVQCR